MFQVKEKDYPRPKKDLMLCVDPCKQGLGIVPNRAIGQIKVQRKHWGPEEATWEMEYAMRLTHPFCSSLQSIEVVPI